MELPRDRIAAACLKSQFKDDRHDWRLIMYESGMTLSCVGPKPKYTLRQCKACGLTALLREVEGGGMYTEAPRKDSEVLYSFFTSVDHD